MEMKIPEVCTVCKTCGFVKEIPREMVITTDNILDLIQIESNTCIECGHQKDGSTIPVVHAKISEVANKLINERDAIWNFVKEYFDLFEEDRKNVCIKIPRCIKPNHEFTGDWTKDDIEEPYSWNVVMIEVKANTRLGKILVREWYNDKRRNERKN